MPKCAFNVGIYFVLYLYQVQQRPHVYTYRFTCQFLICVKYVYISNHHNTSFHTTPYVCMQYIHHITKSCQSNLISSLIQVCVLEVCTWLLTRVYMKITASYFKGVNRSSTSFVVHNNNNILFHIGAFVCSSIYTYLCNAQLAQVLLLLLFHLFICAVCKSPIGTIGEYRWLIANIEHCESRTNTMYYFGE